MTDSWAIVELMGHVKLAGRVSEEEKFGTKLGRIDIPLTPSPMCGDCRGTGFIKVLDATADQKQTCPCADGFTTQYFGGQSIYRFTPCTEETARATARGNQPKPIEPWDARRLLTPPKPVSVADEMDYHDDDEDEGD